jgi:hypothetical protein
MASPATSLTFLFLLLGPSTAGAQTAADLRREAEGQARAGGNLPWDSATPLAWSQFRAKPQPAYFTAAQTSSSVTYLIGCLRTEARFAVLATFSTTESWVRPDVSPDSIAGPQTLRHEQTHFDLSEVFARELRRALGTTPGLCPANLQAARQLFDSLSAVSKALNARYDEDTGHGTVLDAQAVWSARVRAQLDSLAAFADPAGPGP